ncbi:MAG: signal peptide peptidase SppA [Saprospiraceae bacterium]|nr:signal peptide peptidase SppA [Candidatus Opimibacter skivensis]
MKDFLKYTMASCLGVFLAGAVFFFLFFAIIAGIIASTGGGGGKTTITTGSVLALDFTQYMPEQTNNLSKQSFDFSEHDVPGLHDVARLIRHAAEDKKINGILIENGLGGLGASSAKVILDALEDFKESDKFLAAYGDFYTQQGYYLASPADHITLHPVGTVDFRGFASYVPFFKGLLDKIGIDMQIYYAGNFKSATEPFRRTEMSPENKLQTREYLTDTYDMYLQDIADARQINVDSLKNMAWQFQIKSAEDALRYKLVDEIGAKADCESWMNEKMGKGQNDRITYINIEEYASATPNHQTNLKAKDKIAIIYAEGDIVSGNDEYGVIDDGRYVKLLKDIRKQDEIKAVVLRINSPGGSILSAENIYRQLVGLQADGKKLVISMGDLAASGGYYLSAMADSIFAQPNTLTGSIGVFSLIPNPSRALDEKLGVRFDTVRTGPYSADFTVMFPWQEREHTYMQQRTDAYYELFLNKVAEGRDMTRDEVHAVAQGRIWSGKKALELGLVDKLGTLEDAIASAATLAGLEEYRIKEYPVFQNPLQKMITDLMDQNSSGTSAMFKTEIPQIMRFWQVVQSGEPQARLPWGLTPIN